MPLYVCYTAKGAVPEPARKAIAEDITRIHCEVTGAPAIFVHAFFMEESPFMPLEDKSAILMGTIRKGRSDDDKSRIVDGMREAIAKHAGFTLSSVGARTADVPASWAMEGGEVMPEPGDEEAWLARIKH